MTYAAGRMVLAFAFCCAMTTAVNAQTAETESKMDKYLRLSKEADENPTNWQAQLEVGHILLDKESGVYNQSRAAKYYERIYQQAVGVNKEVPDSVFLESVVMLMTVATDKKDVNKVLFYIDELMRADKIGMNINRDYVTSYNVMAIVFNLMNNNAAKALCNIQDARKLLIADKKVGIDYSDPMTVMLYENLLSEYRKSYGDKLTELTLDGKKYVIIANGSWNVEMPLMGWLGGLGNDGGDKSKELKLFYSEQINMKKVLITLAALLCCNIINALITNINASSSSRTWKDKEGKVHVDTYYRGEVDAGCHVSGLRQTI